ERQADGVALRHELVGRRVDRRDEAARDQQRDTAPGEHEHERRDDRLHPDHRHQESVPGAEQHADQHRDADRTEHGAQVVGRRRAVDDRERDGTRDGHDGADGEVDAARRDHDHHAERDEHERGAVAQDVDQRAVELVALDRHAHEARAGDRVDDDERHERRDRQHEAVGEDLLHAALSGLSGWGCSSAMKATRSSTPMSCEVSSPILRRSRITTMRWAMRMTSSSSEEMKTTARPCSESSATLRWMSALAPTSMPRVGSSRMMSCGAVASQRARSTFCWLPPERLRTSAFGFAGRTPRAWMYSSTMVSCSDLRTLRAALGLDAEHDVLGHGEVAHESLGAAVLGGEGDAAVDRVAGVRDTSRATAHLDASGIRAICAVEQPHEFGATGAQEAGEADDLAVVHLDICRMEHAPATHTGCPDDGIARAVDRTRGALRDRVEFVELAADHLRDELAAGEVLDGVLADERAVAQHGEAVGDLVDLVEEVRHEQDRDA